MNLSKPFIKRVFDPASSDFAVHVTVDASLNSHQWTAYETLFDAFARTLNIHSDEYNDFTLVQIVPMQDSENAVFIFRQLPSNERVTEATGAPSRVPAKFADQITRTVTVTDVDPDTALTAIAGDVVFSEVAKQEGQALSVKTDVEETINEDASPLVGSGFAPQGTEYLSSEELVDEGTAEERGVNVLDSVVEPIGGGKAVKQTRTARKRNSSNTYVAGHPTKQVKSKGVESLTPAKYKRLVEQITTATQQTLAASEVDDIPEPSTPSGDETLREHEKINDERYERRITEEVIDEGASPLEGEQTGTWGVESTEESLVDEGTAATSGFLTKESRVVPLGNGKSVKEVITYPDVASTNIIYTLLEENQDDNTGIIVDIEKSLVNAAQAASLATTKRGSGWDVELNAVDKWHSIMIASKVDTGSLPAARIYPGFKRYDFPDLLTSISVDWSVGKGFAAGANSPDVAYWDSNKDRKAFTVQAQANVAVSGNVAANIINGYSGPCKSRRTRTYLTALPNTYQTVTEIIPVTGTLVIKAVDRERKEEAGFDGGSVGETVSTTSTTIKIGPVIHDSVTLTSNPGDLTQSAFATTGSTPWGGTYPAITVDIAGEAYATLTLPSSTNPPASGQWFVISDEVEEWRLGIYVRDVVEIQVP